MHPTALRRIVSRLAWDERELAAELYETLGYSQDPNRQVADLRNVELRRDGYARPSNPRVRRRRGWEDRDGRPAKADGRTKKTEVACDAVLAFFRATPGNAKKGEVVAATGLDDARATRALRILERSGQLQRVGYADWGVYRVVEDGTEAAERIRDFSERAAHCVARAGALLAADKTSVASALTEAERWLVDALSHVRRVHREVRALELAEKSKAG